MTSTVKRMTEFFPFSNPVVNVLKSENLKPSGAIEFFPISNLLEGVLRSESLNPSRVIECFPVASSLENVLKNDSWKSSEWMDKAPAILRTAVIASAAAVLAFYLLRSITQRGPILNKKIPQNNAQPNNEITVWKGPRQQKISDKVVSVFYESTKTFFIYFANKTDFFVVPRDVNQTPIRLLNNSPDSQWFLSTLGYSRPPESASLEKKSSTTQENPASNVPSKDIPPNYRLVRRTRSMTSTSSTDQSKWQPLQNGKSSQFDQPESGKLWIEICNTDYEDGKEAFLGFIKSVFSSLSEKDKVNCHLIALQSEHLQYSIDLLMQNDLICKDKLWHALCCPNSSEEAFFGFCRYTEHFWPTLSQDDQAAYLKVVVNAEDSKYTKHLLENMGDSSPMDT